MVNKLWITVTLSLCINIIFIFVEVFIIFVVEEDMISKLAQYFLNVLHSKSFSLKCDISISFDTASAFM